MENREIKIYKVKRYLIEEFEVEAYSRADAKTKELLDPNRITVIKETYSQTSTDGK